MRKFESLANVCRMFGFQVFYRREEGAENHYSFWFYLPKEVSKMLGSPDYGFLKIVQNSWWCFYYKDIPETVDTDELFNWLSHALLYMKEKVWLRYEYSPYVELMGDGSVQGLYLDEQIVEAHHKYDEYLESEYAQLGGTKDHHPEVTIGDIGRIETTSEKVLPIEERRAKERIEALFAYLTATNNDFREYVRVFGDEISAKIASRSPKITWVMPDGTTIKG